MKQGVVTFELAAADGGSGIDKFTRSSVEVHPEFSEAPDLRSSLPNPKNDLSKNQIASR